MGRMSKLLYAGSYAFFLAAGAVCLLFGLVSGPPRIGLIIAGGAPILCAKLTFLIFLYCAWRSLGGDERFRPKLSPRRAILPLFIPLFNFYWQFPAFAGFVGEFNRFARETGRQRFELPGKKARMICVLTFIPPAWPAVLFMLGAFMADICDAVNALAAGSLSLAREGLPEKLIEVENLTRRYGSVTAVDGISFSVKKGEVVGFLGPNGAGKTTTMRILTGYLPATSGMARIAGHDVFKDSLAARRMIGYMPEGLALYPEMRAIEYLRFRARVKGVPAWARAAAVAGCMERCGVSEAAWKLIGSLSKGYRQRVGLADALINDPPILILDEPTVGLDPNQIKQAREMIRELGRDHTVLLSTHILPEVEAVCGRALLINRGRIALDMPVEHPSTGGAGFPITFEASGPKDRIISALSKVEGIQSVRPDDDSGLGKGAGSVRLTILQKPGADARAGIFRAMSHNEWPILEMSRKRTSLEEIFARYTTGAEPLPEEAEEMTS